MARPLSPALAAARDRLQSGERLSARDVWAGDPRISRSTAHITLRRWRLQGVIHVVEWRRYESNGQPAPVYAWGAGKDAARPKRMTKYESIKRWRANHPDLVVAQLNRAKARRLAARPPALCPVMAALTGMKL